METWFRVGSALDSIEPIEVERTTDMLLFLPNGDKLWKVSSYVRYFHTREDAKLYIVHKLQNLIDEARGRVEFYSDKLQNANKL